MTISNVQQLGKRIKKIREGFKFSQEYIAKHLAIPRQSVSQIERGERSVDSLELAKIARIFEMSTDELLASSDAVPKRTSSQKHNSKISFERHKLRNLLLYILARCGGKPNVGETVIYKLLYFIDFDSYELYRKSVTGMKYVRLQFGPVPSIKEYQSVIQNMIQREELRIISQEYHGTAQKRYIAFVEADTLKFSQEELRIADDVIARLSNMNATKIADYVHEDMPWKVTSPGDEIDYETVYLRTPAFSKRDYQEVMEGSSGRDSLEELGKMSKEEYEYYKNL